MNYIEEWGKRVSKMIDDSYAPYYIEEKEGDK